MDLTSSFGLDPAIEARFRSMGPIFSPDIVALSREIFAAGRNLAVPEGGARTDDVPYGNHARQVLDIVTPGKSDTAPVVLFVPGGGLTGGDKSFYANIPACFARLGFIGLAMNYRLAPEFLFPSGAEDVSSAIDWVRGNISDYGGDPDNIFVFGQSAGAIHTASSIFDARLHPQALPFVRAVLLMSGVYEVTPDFETANINLYFGNDETELRDRSATTHAASSTVPVITAVAELEPSYFAQSAAALMKSLASRGHGAPETIWLRGHNHLSAVLNLGGAGDLLGEAIARRFDRMLAA